MQFPRQIELWRERLELWRIGLAAISNCIGRYFGGGGDWYVHVQAQTADRSTRDNSRKLTRFLCQNIFQIVLELNGPCIRELRYARNNENLSSDPSKNERGVWGQANGRARRSLWLFSSSIGRGFGNNYLKLLYEPPNKIFLGPREQFWFSLLTFTPSPRSQLPPFNLQ